MNLSPEMITAYVTAIVAAVGAITLAAQRAAAAWKELSATLGIKADTNLHALVTEIHEMAKTNAGAVDELTTRLDLNEEISNGVRERVTLLETRVARLDCVSIEKGSQAKA